MRNYFENIAYNFAAQTICLGAGLLSNIIVARLLGPEGKGIIVLLSNYISILVIIFMFGMSEGNAYYLSKGSYAHSDVLSTDFFHTIAMTIVFFALSLLLKNVLTATFLKGIPTQFFYISLFLFPVQFIYLHFITILQGNKKLKDYSLSFVIRSITLLILQIFLIPIWNVSGGIVALILSVIIINVFNVTKLLQTNFNLRIPNFNFLRDSLLFGIKSQVGLLLNFFERRLDYFIVNLFLEPVQVGLYSAAVIIAELPWYLPNAVGTVIFPEITSKKKEEAYRFVAFVCRNTIFITLIITVIIGFLSGILVKFIFGSRFIASILPLQILLPGIIFLALNRIICVGFSGTGRPELGTLTVVFSFIMTLVLDLLLIPKSGIKGASLASTVSYFTSALAGLIIFHKISHLPFADIILFKISDLKKYSVITKYIRSFKKDG